MNRRGCEPDNGDVGGLIYMQNICKNSSGCTKAGRLPCCARADRRLLASAVGAADQCA